MNPLRRKMAIAAWDSPREPNIYGRMTLDAEPALAYVDHLRKTTGEKVTLTTVVGKAVAAKPNAVLLGTAGDITATLVNEFKKVSPSTPLAATSVALSGDNLRQLGGKASGIALSMVLPDAARTSFAVVRDYQKAMRALGYQEFSARSFEGYVNARVLAEGLERAGRDLTRAKLRNALAGIRSNDLGGLSIDYAGGAPYVGSRFLDLGVMGANGRFIG